jgi:two-component system C4-dicarboxylate transport response regulator DctD
MNEIKRVLVIDDDREVRESIQHLLTSAGFEVEMLSSGTQIIGALDEHDFDVILCDVKMPNMTGLEVQQQLKNMSQIPLVLMSAHGDIPMAVSAIQDGAYSFLEKPFDPRRLITILENAARFSRLKNKNLRLVDRLANLSGLDRILVGETAIIKKLRDEVIDLADTSANVLIVGETGTGKELVARALHDLSARSAENFVALNCAALPSAQVEEALFGRAGSASGYLDRADGGTLFLDELGAIPAELQPKLLRVLETREFTPVGQTEPRNSDFRLISAGNEKLVELVNDGRFREDLYFRLNTMIVNLPPLRARGGDIPVLYAHFMQQFATSYEIQVPETTADDLSVLMSHDWPGNVRELRHVCERRILMARREGGSAFLALNDSEVQAPYPETLREAVAAFESQLIARAIKSHNGKMDAIAEALGIGRRTLNEKIVKLGLNKEKLLDEASLRKSAGK